MLREKKVTLMCARTCMCKADKRSMCKAGKMFSWIIQ